MKLYFSPSNISMVPCYGTFYGPTYFLTHSLHIVGHESFSSVHSAPRLKPFWKAFRGSAYKLLCTCHDRYIASLTFNKWDKINKPFCWEGKYGSVSQKWQAQSIRSTWFLKYFQSCLRFFKEDFFYTNYTAWRYHWHRPFGFLWSESDFNERNSSFIGSWWGFCETFQYPVGYEKVRGTGVDVNYMQIQANTFSLL